MQPIKAPKATASKKFVGKRARYWSKHEQPEKKINKVPGYQKRLWREDRSLAQIIADLGNKSDAVVARERQTDLMRNRAFVEHQQKLDGAITRLRKLKAWARGDQASVSIADGIHCAAQGEIRTLPHRVEQDHQRAVHKMLDRRYSPCLKVKSCSMYDGHVGDCRDDVR